VYGGGGYWGNDRGRRGGGYGADRCGQLESGRGGTMGQ
jgi:hypothetical protein